MRTVALLLLIGFAACEETASPDILDGVLLDDVVSLGARGSATEFPVVPAMVRDVGDEFLFTFPVPYLPRMVAKDGSSSSVIGSEGEGPGEFRIAVGAAGRIPGDSLLIHDVFQGRATVFSSSGSLERSLRLSGSFIAFEVVHWPSEVLAVGHLRPTDGTPLHIVDFGKKDASVSLSFGADEDVDFTNTFALEQRTSGVRNGRFWAARRDRYRLRRWTVSGELEADLTPEVPWFPSTSAWASHPDSVPKPYIWAIDEDDSGNVWVFARVARPNWARAWDGIDTSHGEFHSPAGSDLYLTQIEVRSPDGALLGSATTHGVPIGSLGGQHLVLGELDKDGFPLVRVVMYSLAGAH